MGSYINIHKLQGWDLKKRFLRYCEENYINYLKESNRTRLVEKFNRINDNNQSEHIKSFFEDNFFRVLLFIDDKYNPSFKYDAPYKRTLFNVYLDKSLAGQTYHYPSIHFQEEHNRRQRGYLSDLYRKFIIDFTIQEEIIQCDGKYIPAHAEFCDEAKSYGYRIHPKFYSNEFIWKRKRIVISRKDIKKNYTSGKYKIYKHLPPHIKAIREMMGDWSLRIDKIPEDLKEKVDKYFEKDYFAYSDHHGCRITSSETNIFKALRPYLQYNNKREKYKLVEVSNCHHYAFAVYLANYAFHFDYASMPEFHEVTPDDTALHSEHFTILQKAADYFKNYDFSTDQLDELAGCVQHIVHEDESYKNIRKFLSDYSVDGQLTSIEYLRLRGLLAEDREKILFILLSVSGLIYDALSRRYRMNRSQFKDEFTPVFNFTRNAHRNGLGLIRKFRNSFTTVFDELIYLSKKRNNKYSQIMTRFETKLMIDNVSKELIEDGQHFVNFHDGIMVKESIAEEVKAMIEDHSLKLFNLKAPVRIEDI